jgi:hypothetical protein
MNLHGYFLQKAGYGKHQYRPCPHAKIKVPPSSFFFFGRNRLFNVQYSQCIEVTVVLENARAFCEYRIQNRSKFPKLH